MVRVEGFGFIFGGNSCEFGFWIQGFRFSGCLDSDIFRKGRGLRMGGRKAGGYSIQQTHIRLCSNPTPEDDVLLRRGVQDVGLQLKTIMEQMTQKKRSDKASGAQVEEKKATTFRLSK